MQLSIGTTNVSVFNGTHQFAGLGNNLFRGFSTFFIVWEPSWGTWSTSYYKPNAGKTRMAKKNLESTGDDCISEPFMGLEWGKYMYQLQGINLAVGVL